MKLRNVVLERFGCRSHLRLENLNPGINVIFGANGSGKSTLVNCIQWVLFDQVRPMETRDPLGALVSPSAAVEVIQTDGRLVSLRRDGSEDWRATSGRSPYGRVSSADFREVFCIQETSGHLPELLRIAVDHRMPLSTAPLDDRRLADLRRREAGYRDRLAVMPAIRHNRDRLRDDHRRLAARVATLREQQTREWERLDRENRLAGAEQEVLRNRIARVQLLIDRLDRRIARRRHMLDQSVQFQRIARDEWFVSSEFNRDTSIASGQNARLENIQLEHWQSVHADMQRECERLQAWLRGRPESLDRSPLQHAHRMDYLSQTLDLEIDDHADCLDDRSMPPRRHHMWDTFGEERTCGDPISSPGGRTEADYQAESDRHRLRITVEEYRQRRRHRAGDTHANAMHDAVDDYRYRVDRDDLDWRVRHDRRDARDVRDALDHLDRSRVHLQGMITHVQQARKLGLDGFRYDVSPYMPITERPASDSADSLRVSESMEIARRMHHRAIDRLAVRREQLVRWQDRWTSDARRLDARLHELDSRKHRRNDPQIDECQLQLESIDTELRAWEEREELLRGLGGVIREIDRIRKERLPDSLARHASFLLARLTGGAYLRLRLHGLTEPLVEDRQRYVVPLGQVSREVQGLVAICLQLAMSIMFRQAGLHLPLLVDRHFAWSDPAASRAMARVLHELANAGQQILLFTADRPFAQCFEAYEASVYTLVRRSVSERAASDVGLPRHPAADHSARFHPAPHALSSFDQTALDQAALDRTALDRTALDRTALDRTARDRTARDETSFGHSAIDGWPHWDFRYEAPSETWPLDDDAGLDDAGLDGAGFDDDAQLGHAAYVANRQRVRSDRRTVAEQGFDGSARGEHGQPWPWPRRSLERRSTIPFSGSYVATDAPRRYRDDASEGLRGDSRHVDYDERRKNGSPRAGREDRERSTAVDVAREPEREATVSRSREPSDDALRYYLQRGDNVVDAPSIGQRLSAKLAPLGVHTVEDLLQCDPVDIADRLATRGVTADVVRDWQDQARLVCQVPFLRGHDAQFLVACNVRRPSELAGRDDHDLWQEVDRFVETPDGRRVLRSGKRPDLAEVQDWIRWAGDARSLDAA